jgi:hypothetical protein
MSAVFVVGMDDCDTAGLSWLKISLLDNDLAFMLVLKSTDNRLEDFVLDDKFSTDEDFPKIFVKNLFFGLTTGFTTTVGLCISGIFFFPTSLCLILADRSSNGSSRSRKASVSEL